MASEVPFRVALFVVMLLTMTVTAYHRLQAAEKMGKWGCLPSSPTPFIFSGLPAIEVKGSISHTRRTVRSYRRVFAG